MADKKWRESSQEQPLRDIIALIYDAALNPGCWCDVLSAIAEAAACDDVHFGLYDRHEERQVLTGQSLVPAEVLRWGRERKNGALCNAFSPKTDTTFEMLSTISVSRHWFAVFFAGNCEGRGAFSQTQRSIIEEILPHVRRALLIYVEMYVLKCRGAILSEFIDKLSIAIFALAEKSTLLQMNASGQRLLQYKDGLHSYQNRLIIEDHEAARICFGFTDAGKSCNSYARSNSFLIHRPSGKHPYVAVASPVSTANNMWSTEERAILVLCVSDPDNSPRKLGATLAQVYGLTGAEARLAAAIARGQTVVGYADERNVSSKTVRFQIKQILNKSELKRQADFIRIIASTLNHFEV